MRGPKPKPAKSDKPATLSPPVELSAAARAEWDRLVPTLEESGVLHQLDVDAITIYCNSYAIFKQCQTHIDQNGPVVVGTTGTPVKNPFLMVQKDCWDRMRVLLGELGLTPSARARLGFNEGKSSDDDEVSY